MQGTLRKIRLACMHVICCQRKESVATWPKTYRGFFFGGLLLACLIPLLACLGLLAAESVLLCLLAFYFSAFFARCEECPIWESHCSLFGGTGSAWESLFFLFSFGKKSRNAQNE